MKMMGLIGRRGGGVIAPPNPFTIYALEQLTNVVADRADLAGRALFPGPGGSWRNIATNLLTVKAGTPPRITGAGSATGFYVCDQIGDEVQLEDGSILQDEIGNPFLLEGSEPVNQECLARFRYSSYSNSSCGLILQAVGDFSTGTRYDCFISIGSPNRLTINRCQAGVETTLAQSSLGASSYFPINTEKTMRFRLLDNGDDSYTLSVFVDDVLIVSGVDVDPLIDLGAPGIRGRSTMDLYEFTHRSLVIDSGGAPVDTIAPTLSGATDAATGQTTATASVTTDEANGTLWWVVTTSPTAPGGAQIRAGQNELGAAASASGSVAITTIGVKTVTPTGLTADTQYYTHFLHRDAANNDSAVISADGFRTTAALALRGVALSASSTTDSTSFTPAMVAHQPGDTLFMVVVADNAPLMSVPAGGWPGLNAASQSTNVKLAIFRRDAVAETDHVAAPTIVSDTAQQFACAMIAVSGPSLLNAQMAFSSGLSAAADPPPLTIAGGPLDCILMALLGLNNGGNAVSFYPAGYSGGDYRGNGGSGGVVVASCSRTAPALSSTNPAAFTNSNTQWVAATLAIST